MTRDELWLDLSFFVAAAGIKNADWPDERLGSRSSSRVVTLFHSDRSRSSNGSDSNQRLGDITGFPANQRIHTADPVVMMHRSSGTGKARPSGAKVERNAIVGSMKPANQQIRKNR